METPMKKHKKRFKISKIFKYFRELSIVIIGVLITLYITGITSDKSRQKEVKELMDLIKTELNDNLEDIEEAQRKWNREQQAFAYLKDKISNLQAIPVDSLKRYRDINVMGGHHIIVNIRDSYEVFKSSLLFQYVKDKDLLRKLAETYRKLDVLSWQLNRYSERKSKGINEMFEGMNEKQIEQWTKGTIYDYFQIPLRYDSIRLFVYDGGSILDPKIFNASKQMIREMIAEIDRQKF